MGILHFSDSNRLWILKELFVSDTIQVYIPSKSLLT